MKKKFYFFVSCFYFLIIFSIQTIYPQNSKTEIMKNAIASQKGCSKEDIQIVNTGKSHFPLLNKKLTWAKARNTRTEEIYNISLDENDNVADDETLSKEENILHEKKYGKFSEDLHEKLQAMSDSDMVKVEIILNGDDGGAIESPTYEETQSQSQEEIETKMNAQYNEKISKIKTIEENFKEKCIDLQGYNILLEGEMLPVMIIELSKSELLKLAVYPEIKEIYYHTIDLPNLDISIPTTWTDKVWAKGITGSRIKVAVVDASGIDFSHPNLSNPDSKNRINGYYALDDYHATRTAGVIACRKIGINPFQGVAYNATLLGANFGNTNILIDYNAIEWAINPAPDRNARIINYSRGDYRFGLYMKNYGINNKFDAYVFNNRITIVVSAGNTVDINAPAMSYNCIAVGSYDDKNTVSWTDDIMGIGSGTPSPFNDPISTNGDREKPEVVAPGVEIVTTFVDPYGYGFRASSGTSFAAPHVAGLAALLCERNPNLLSWPEAIKAIIMATAVHNLEGSSSLLAIRMVLVVLCRILLMH